VSGCHSYNVRSYEDLRKCVKRDLGAGIEKVTIYVHPLKGTPLPDGAEIWQLKSWADYTMKERRDAIDNLKNEMTQAGVQTAKFYEILRGLEGSPAGAEKLAMEAMDGSGSVLDTMSAHDSKNETDGGYGMIDIPIGKALAAVEVNSKDKPACCRKCFFCEPDDACKAYEISCSIDNRKDGKSVIFKLVDWPGEGTVQDSDKPLRWEINGYDKNDYTVGYFVECPKCETGYDFDRSWGDGDRDYFERHKYCPSCGIRLLPGEDK